MAQAKRDAVSRGYLYAVLATICNGAIPTLSKILLRDNQPVMVAGASIFLSGLVLGSFRPRATPPRASLPYIMYLGVIGAGVAPVLYFVGLSQTTAVNAALLGNAEVLFTALLAFAVVGERLNRRQVATGLVIVAGIVVVATNFDLAYVQLVQGLVGNLLILAAALAWGIENNLIVVAARRFGAPLLSKFRNLIGGSLIVAFLVVAGIPARFSANDIGVLSLLVLTYAGVTFLFISALEMIGAIRMVLIFSLATALGPCFALLFLGEQITIVQIAGGAAIMVGVYLFRRSESPAPQD